MIKADEMPGKIYVDKLPDQGITEDDVSSLFDSSSTFCVFFFRMLKLELRLYRYFCQMCGMRVFKNQISGFLFAGLSGICSKIDVRSGVFFFHGKRKVPSK